MKKRGFLFAFVIILCGLTACGGVTHCKDCDDEIYKDGYCQYHYTLHNVDKTVKGAFDSIFGD